MGLDRVCIISVIRLRPSLGDFPGGPVVRTPCFLCRGCGFDPLSGELKSHKPPGGAKKKKKKRPSPANNGNWKSAPTRASEARLGARLQARNLDGSHGHGLRHLATPSSSSPQSNDRELLIPQQLLTWVKLSIKAGSAPWKDPI